MSADGEHSSSYHIANFFGLTESPQRKRGRAIDVGAVITRALTALGFKK
jgi:hypothetical protein